MSFEQVLAAYSPDPKMEAFLNANPDLVEAANKSIQAMKQIDTPMELYYFRYHDGRLFSIPLNRLHDELRNSEGSALSFVTELSLAEKVAAHPNLQMHKISTSGELMKLKAEATDFKTVTIQRGNENVVIEANDFYVFYPIDEDMIWAD